jgi:hypothetical protein
MFEEQKLGNAGWQDAAMAPALRDASLRGFGHHRSSRDHPRLDRVACRLRGVPPTTIAPQGAADRGCRSLMQ